MATQIRLVFNEDGFKALLGGDAMRAEIEAQTNAIKQRADANIAGESEGFNAKVEMGRSAPYADRWVGIVGTSDYASEVAESENGALTKAVH